jgi:hypothetical protein
MVPTRYSMLTRVGSHVRGNFVGYLALFIALGGTTYAATGGNFILGKSNSASNPTSLSAPVTGKALQVTNTKTSAGATALGLNVASGHPPFTVNSGGKVANLNADKLDSLDSSAFYRSSNVKSKVFHANLCTTAFDTGCAVAFSFGNLSLSMVCFSDNGGSDAHVELNNTSPSNQVALEYLTSTGTGGAVIVPANQPILDVDANVPPSVAAQGTLIDMTTTNPETANFQATVQKDVSAADCQLRLVAYKPQ